MEGNDRVHVVIPVYGRADLLRRNLDFLSQTPLATQRTTIIDDAYGPSTSIALQEIAAAYPTVEILRNKENLGFGQSVNSVALKTDKEFSLIVNSDIVFRNFSVSRQLEAMDQNQNLAVIGYTTSKGNYNRVTWGLPLDSGLADLTRAFLDLGDPQLNKIYILDGGALFFRTASFQHVGGFDPIFGKGYGEDVDIGIRLLDAGFELACDTRTFYHHTGGASFGASKENLLSRAKSILVDRWKQTYIRYDRYQNTYRHSPLSAGLSSEKALPPSVEEFLRKCPL